MDTESEFKKLDEVEIKRFEENAELKKLLSSVGTSTKNITLGEATIRIKAYMPRTTRLKFIKITKDLGAIDSLEAVEQMESRFYPLVASMCIDAPFNEVKTWQYIDEQQGCIQDVVMKIIAEVNKVDTNIKTFR